MYKCSSTILNGFTCDSTLTTCSTAKLTLKITEEGSHLQEGSHSEEGSHLQEGTHSGEGSHPGEGRDPNLMEKTATFKIH